jgi:phage terminase Nu1 subunit (DNA packaging protein)
VRTNRDEPEDIALDLARARNLQADTRLKELREARERREVAPVALMQWTLAHAGAQIAALLETIPGQVKRALPSLGAAELEIIKRAVVSAQNTAAALALDFDDYDAADPAPALGPASGPAPGARQPGAP